MSDSASIKNKYCALKDLKNEATVESRFVDRMLDDLGFLSEDIKLKSSLREFKVGKGSKSSLYKPDYILLCSGLPTVVIDAKSTIENISDFEQQCSSYCLEINKSFDHNPVRYYVLSNGVRTAVYKWDAQKPILQLEFLDFDNKNPKYRDLVGLLGKKALALSSRAELSAIGESNFNFEVLSLSELSGLFQRMHQYIWAKEKKSPSAAFEELMKIVFVKIQKDRELYKKFGSLSGIKLKDVVFSTHWIDTQTESDSPINDPLFKNLVKALEIEIRNDKKKRIFEEGEEIRLSSDTIRWVVKELQNIDFVSMEDDIHGRMFETFLEATVRGRDLGQFFTPRDIVNLMVNLAGITVSKSGVPKVLDACCGSGGFLIAAMGEMTKQANNLAGTSNKERSELVGKIKNNCLFGIDAGSDPAIYRIARMNMYLHGDGGSHIYHADSLDKTLGAVGNASIEYNKQLTEARKIFIEQNTTFDVILSNPPFSLKYSRDDSEQEVILNQYEMAVDRQQGKVLKSLLSSVMFLERYRDLVSEHGRILAIIDDSILSGSSYAHIRSYIKDNFIVLGIISLPGDAFRRASARVKTSILILRKKKEGETQSDVFMTSSLYLGLEQKTARRIGVKVSTLNAEKAAEALQIAADFGSYLKGITGPYAVPFSRLNERMDVKFCIGGRGRKSKKWKSLGLTVCGIDSVLAPALGRSIAVSDADFYQFLRVTYDGEVVEGDLIEGAECSYGKLYKVETWDILLSNMGVGRGAVGIVPPFHAGKVVSNEYTILRAHSEEEAVYYCSLLRTKEILADVLSVTTGMNRGRIKWESISKVLIPRYSGNKDIVTLTADLKAYWKSFERFEAARRKHVGAVSVALGVDGPDSHRRWLAFKPPE